MRDSQILHSTIRAVRTERKHKYGGLEAFGRDMAIDAMVEAERKAAEGDPMAQRIVVQIGALMPHLINA